MQPENSDKYDTEAILKAAFKLVNMQPNARAGAVLLPKMCDLISAAEARWTNPVFSEWRRALRAALTQKAADGAYEDSKTFTKLCAWTWAPSDGSRHAADALLGSTIVKGLSVSGELPLTWLVMLERLKSAATSQSRRLHLDWSLVVDKYDMTDDLSVAQASRDVGQRSPVRNLLNAIPIYLPVDLKPPPVLVKRSQAATQEIESTPSVTVGKPSPVLDQASESSEGSEQSPCVSHRVASANWASYAEKLGLHHKNVMPMQDLAHISKQLHNILDASFEHERHAFALLALVSLLTSSIDAVVLSLGFKPVADRMWIARDASHWAWDFCGYTRGPVDNDTNSPRSIQATQVPFPVIVQNAILYFRRVQPQATTVGELLGINDLVPFRRFLRGLAQSPAILPTRARFPRSLYSAALQITRSDMLASIMCCRFEASAPAALHYFGPEPVRVHDACHQLFTALHLGPVATIFDAAHVGSLAVPNTVSLHAAWQGLVSDIEAFKRKRKPSAAEINTAMVHLTCCFVMCTGHRASRFDQLSHAALFGSVDVISVIDKEDVSGGPDRTQPRLIPVTHALGWVLSSAAQVWQTVETETRREARRDEPVFIQLDKAGRKRQCITTSSLTAEFRARLVDSANIAPNTARHWWVTELDRNLVDRWLIRSLTGHSRDLTRVNGPAFDVPPIVVARRLRTAMNATGGGVFSVPAPIKPSSSTRWFAPAASTLERWRRRNPSGPLDLPSLLAPLDANVLTGWNCARDIRNRLVAGAWLGHKHVSAFLALLLIDMVSDPTLALKAVVAPDDQTRQIGACRYLIWRRPHFVHDTLIPMHPFTVVCITALDKTIESEKLVGDVTQALRSVFPYWPENTRDSRRLLHHVAQSWRRMELPPSLVATSHLDVPAPCLSEHSILRLSQPNHHHEVPPPHFPPARRSDSKRGADLAWLVKTTAEFSDTTKRLGERQQRAKTLLKKLASAPITWGPHAEWLRDYVIDELKRTATLASRSLQISSIETYLRHLARGEHFHGLDEPQDWSEVEWSEFIQRVQQTAGTENARSPLLSIMHSLHRRGESPPQEAWAALSIAENELTARDSSSSVLVSVD